MRALLIFLAVPIFAPVVCAQEPLLTELMVDNNGTLADQDGQFHGWVEIHNPSASVSMLAGWFLTDNASEPDKWQLPDTTIAPYGFVLVFTSGKNRTLAGNELHSNFQLNKEAPYVALVRPNRTISSQFGPGLPPQRADKSFGMGMQIVTETTPPANPLEPASLQPYVWLKADVGVTTNATGNTVALWQDRSINAFVFRADHPRATANDPAITSGPVAGTFAVNFDGTDIIDSDSSLQLFTTGNSPLVVFAVLRPTSITGTQRFVVNHAPGLGGQSYELGQDSGQVSPSGAWSIHRGSGQATSTAPNSLVSGQYRITTAEVLSTGSAGTNVRFHTNGVLRPNVVGNWTAAGAYHIGSDPLAIGARVDNKGQGFNTLTPDGYFIGDIAEIIIYRNALTGGERAGVENFLLQKYGFPLPSGTVTHPVIAQGELGYFPVATPGTTNARPVVDFVADTKFTPDRGFYTTNISVTITCATPGASIRYTTNSELPEAGAGVVYTGPILIGQTTVIRAAAFRDGWAPSDVDTHTYIFAADVATQPPNPAGFPASGWGRPLPDYAMDPEVITNSAYSSVIQLSLLDVPGISLVTSKSNLWDGALGIYSHPGSEGDAWERPVSFEYINPLTGEQLQTDAGVRIHGGVSRTDGVKLSFRIYFRGRYEEAKLQFPILPDNSANKFDNLVLRAQWNDGWNHTWADNRTAVYLRDEWCRRMHYRMGRLSTVGASMHLYLDGLYWGLYNPVEQINAAFVAEHRGGNETNYDVLKFNTVVEAADGNLSAWNTVIAQAEAGLTTDAAYRQILPLVDVDDLADFMILYIYAGNEDGPAKNYYAWRRRSPAGPFGFIPWDNEWVLGQSFSSLNRIDVNVVNADAPNSATRLYTRLRSNPEFRIRFADRAHKHFFNDGILASDRAQEQYRVLMASITNAIVAESARWGDVFNQNNPGHPFTRNNEWAAANNFLLNTFFVQRPAIVLQQLRSAGLYPLTSAPSFSQHGGAVTQAFNLIITHTNGNGTIFYTVDGSDPRAYGTGAVAPTAAAYSGQLPINTPTLVRARVLNGTQWSALVEAMFHPPQDLQHLRLTELMYHPPDSGLTDGEEFEFLELKNSGTNMLNLSGLEFTAGLAFTFTNRTLLAPGNFIVLVRNATAFAAKYPNVSIHGVYSGKLADEGETIALSHTLGNTVFSLNYGDAAPWPVTPDGHGFSLVQSEPISSQAPDNPRRWRASVASGGSPGADDPPASIPPIVINEILTDAISSGTKKIELFNPTTSDVDIGGWLLSDEKSRPDKYRIPPGTVIGGRAFVVFSESQFNAAPGMAGSFSLSSRGGQLYLFSADVNTNLNGYAHGFQFAATAPGVSFGRYVNSVDDEQFPAQIATSFLTTNFGPRIGPIVINEIHYHPAPGGDEFVELKNISTNPVPLFEVLYPANPWRLNGVGFAFPTNVTLASHGYLLVVATNPAVFRARYGVPDSVPLFGYAGTLQHSGERLSLERPAPPGTNGPAYIVVDDVRYNDRGPWSAAADGAGFSLQRKMSGQYGNDPINWDSAAPTPGQPNTALDSDGDGLPDEWEQAHGTLVDVPDAADDPDSDGGSNLDEYVAGTDPTNGSSRLRLEIILRPSPAIIISTVPNRVYTIQHTADFPATWTEFASRQGTGSPIHVALPDAATGFYRVNVRRW